MAKLQVYNMSTGHDSYDGWHYGPNSAGGVSVRFSFKNLTGKTIKYASFWFIPFNAVNDACSCSITGKSRNGVKYTGPLAPDGVHNGALFENAWYNNSINSVRLTSVYIEYMDGTNETLAGADIDFSAPAGAGGCCVVATCVYGSYDCPQVWTLRRFRDDTLASTWYGRAFIHTYYAVGPVIVKALGNTQWFKKMWKGPLDAMVAKLQSKGVENTPYEDRQW